MKNNQKCVRLSDRVMKYIEAYRGGNFSEKLENLVLDMEEKHEQLELDWNRLQAQISDKHAEMREIQERVRRMRNLDVRLGPVIQELLALLPKE